MASNFEQIVVKRRQRRGRRRDANGAWKVAFADFTLALMSLFLVFWLMEVANPKERYKIAAHLRDYTILDREANPFDIRNSPYPVDLGGNPSTLAEAAPEYTPAIEPGVLYDELQVGHFDSPQQQLELARFIQRMMQDMGAADSVQIEIVPQGLRVLIRDDDKQQMFARGSAQITPFFENLLLRLAPVFVKVQNKVMLSGHTDSASYPSNQYTNWELSGARALKARQVLESGGMPTDRIAEVVALADRMLANQQDPLAGSNRRIELLILTTKADAELAALFNRRDPNSALSQAIKQAHLATPNAANAPGAAPSTLNAPARSAPL